MPSSAENRAAIEARGLVKTYSVRGRSGDVRALGGLDITVRRGTVFGLLGPNGAGKSTTVKILTTHALDEGTAVVEGIDVLRRPDRAAAPRDRRRRAALRQRPDGHRPGEPRPPGAAVRAARRGRAGPRRRAAGPLRPGGRAGPPGQDLLRRHAAPPRRGAGPDAPSQVLFLDEPTTGLDPEARAAMWQEIARLAGDEGLTVLLTTHYLEEADRLAGRLAIVDRGRVIAEGTPDELKGELRGDAVHLELPAETDPAVVRGVLAGLPGVREVLVAGRSVSARSDDGAGAVPGILAALQRAGAPAASVTVARPSLDDVYLRHTGRRYSKAETAAPAAGDAKDLVAEEANR